jgi:hypothetical protein
VGRAARGDAGGLSGLLGEDRGEGCWPKGLSEFLETAIPKGIDSHRTGVTKRLLGFWRPLDIRRALGTPPSDVPRDSTSLRSLKAPRRGVHEHLRAVVQLDGWWLGLIHLSTPVKLNSKRGRREAMVSNWPKVWGWGTLNPRGSPQRSLPGGFANPGSLQVTAGWLVQNPGEPNWASFATSQSVPPRQTEPRHPHRVRALRRSLAPRRPGDRTSSPEGGRRDFQFPPTFEQSSPSRAH